MSEPLLTINQVIAQLRNDGSAGWSTPNSRTCQRLADAIEAHLASREADGVLEGWIVESEKAGVICLERLGFAADKVIADAKEEYGDAYGETTKRPLYSRPAAQDAAKPVRFARFNGLVTARDGFVADLGGVSGHPRLGDMPWVTTSLVREVVYDGHEVVRIVTRNNTYVLAVAEASAG